MSVRAGVYNVFKHDVKNVVSNVLTSAALFNLFRHFVHAKPNTL